MNKNKVLLLIFLMNFFNDTIFSQQQKRYYPWFKILSLREILQRNPTVSLKKCLDRAPYNFEPFQPSMLYPYQGFCSNSFIINIPHGKAQGLRGDVWIDNCFIKEMVYGGLWQLLMGMPKIPEKKILKISGRVAVISQDLTGYYFHWMQDVLGRLALLEMSGIEYDYLYVAYDKKYMKESLELWGIDPKKIISPNGPMFCIEADELIVPSFVVTKNQGKNKYAGFHYNPLIMQYVAKRLIDAAIQKNINAQQFCKKIFISRKDVKNNRRILNEDKIFKLFEKKGFKRYQLSDLSVRQQIILFNQAEIVVGEHGAGLTNSLFCKPGTQIIEIFQALIDSSFWWISQVMGLHYACVTTVPVYGDYFARYGVCPTVYRKAWESQMKVSLKKIKKVVKKL